MKNNTVLFIIEAIIGVAIIAGVWMGVYYAGTFNSPDHRMGSIVARGNELMEAENALQILGGEISTVERFRLPELGDERSIVFIKKTRETPQKYPRRAGKPGKNPL